VRLSRLIAYQLGRFRKYGSAIRRIGVIIPLSPFSNFEICTYEKTGLVSPAGVRNYRKNSLAALAGGKPDWNVNNKTPGMIAEG
jgi:hypothetical protein